MEPCVPAHSSSCRQCPAKKNAERSAAALLDGQPQTFARDELGKSLRELKFDAGPHSVTRMALNDELWRVARGGDLRLAKLAVRAFTVMSESAHLLALSRGVGPVAHSARQAYRALLADTGGKSVAPPSP